MTTIVAYKYKGDVWMGGDSAISNGYNDRILSSSDEFHKVQPVCGWLIGATGQYRTNQLVKQYLESYLEEAKPVGTFEAALQIAECIREIVSDYGSLEHDSDGQERCGSNFVIAGNGEMFLIDYRFEVIQFNEDLLAHGSGGDYATGAWYVLRQSVPGKLPDPERVIEMCLLAAAAYDPGTAVPFVIYKASDHARKRQ